MKFKPVYIYLAFIVVFGAAVVFFSSSANKSSKQGDLSASGQMPNDDIHKGMSSGKEEGPSKNNVMQDAIQKMNELKTYVEKNPNDTVKAREYAEMLTAHKPDEAIQIFENILKKGPGRKDIMLELVAAYFQKGDINKAEEYNNKVLSADKENLAANYNIAGLAQARGDSKKARTVWDNLSKKYPNTDIGHMAGELVKQLDLMQAKK
jgi:tetratricopeptide (TPR) repeat protein